MNQFPRLRLLSADPSPTVTDAANPSGVLGDEVQLFRRHAQYIACIGLRLLGRESDADDLVQQVFIDAFKRREQLRDPNAVRGWLATIAVRTAPRQLRRRRLRRFVGLDDRAGLELRDTGVSPETRPLLARVYEVLEAMPVERRLAWTLRYVDGEKLEQVAERGGCSLETAKRRIAAAHTQLVAELGERSSAGELDDG
jgi:RNA polymerase sigma-70 factor (ECF subfamily)